MKALKIIIISAVLFLGLQSHSFATDEQEDMGLTQQAKLGFSQLPMELQEYLFSFLDQKDFLRASGVCQSWRDVAHLVGEERTLNLSNKKLDQKDCQALLKVPFSLLILRQCRLGKQEALILSRSPRNKLNLVQKLQVWKKHQLKERRVKFLDLGENIIDDDGAKRLAAGNLGALTSLNLERNFIGDDGAGGLASGNLVALISLNLQSNDIGAAGAKGLASGNLAALTSLNLSYNIIGDEGTEGLASGNLAALISLNLQSNSIGAKGARMLASGNLAALTSLNLSYNSIGDAGIKALASGNLGALIDLDLRGNKIGDAGIKALASGNLGALTDLDLRGNKIGEEGKAALRKMISLKNNSLQVSLPTLLTPVTFFNILKK